MLIKILLIILLLIFKLYVALLAHKINRVTKDFNSMSLFNDIFLFATEKLV